MARWLMWGASFASSPGCGRPLTFCGGNVTLLQPDQAGVAPPVEHVVSHLRDDMYEEVPRWGHMALDFEARLHVLLTATAVGPASADQPQDSQALSGFTE